MNETAASGLTVLRMRLPYVDQRSLSEAWISALGLRRDAPPSASSASVAAKPEAAGARSCTCACAPGATSVAPRGAGYPSARTTAGRAVNARPPVASPQRAAVRVARPAVRGAAAEEADARSYPARQSSLTLGVAGERVQLVLRRDGSVLNVIALCRSDIAQTVRLALARAESFLRSRGDAMCASVRTYETAVTLDDAAVCR